MVMVQAKHLFALTPQTPHGRGVESAANCTTLVQLVYQASFLVAGSLALRLLA